MKISIAISGGTDSLFALLSLREQGHEVTAVHARFLPTLKNDPVPAMRKLCDRFGIPLILADLTASFAEQVMTPFALIHIRARTPNPCALCNRTMKFGLLMDAALKHGERYATGHYAAMVEHPVYGLTLRSGSDGKKDQSYFLALVPVERLRLCVFPLAEKKKTDVRAWLAKRGLTPPAPTESQEICFVPENDHYAWLKAWSQGTGTPLPGAGPMVLEGEGRVIAAHRGLWNYTEGQRRGLGIACKEALYVLRRLPESNTLVVGTRDRLVTDSCCAREVNLMVPCALWPEEVFVRTRYHQRPTAAHVDICGDVLKITFASPQSPHAPGQIAAVYDRDGFLLAGGVLD